ncbi:ergosterol biosynthesis ERG4/ERG24 [Cladochytrium replicatum]|nr:ergosterol biosynthesis ERG4/ERG24 [Cladochytrium replicatum]
MAPKLSVAKSTSNHLNPRTTHYEFMGVPGASVCVAALPLVVLFLGVYCDSDGCLPWHGYPDLTAFIDKARSQTFLTIPAFSAYISWYAFQVLLYYIVPGPLVQGTQLRTGKYLTYRINAWRCFLLTIAIVASVCLVAGGITPMLWIADHYVQLSTSAMIVATVQAVAVYAGSFRPGTLLALGGNSGYFIYDFFMGRELNPRWTFGVCAEPWFDVKYFCELRPGLMGWVLIDAALAAKQWDTYGHVTNSLWLVLAFHTIYVADCMYFEDAILSTIDIITDGFGFMLSFGDLAWVPFTYTVQARYLTFYPVELSTWFVGAIFLVQWVGYWIFRSSNNEKNAFKTGQLKGTPKFIETESGGKLLASGWWGWSRHPNYLGDWMMGLAMCLPAGFGHVLPFFYAAYFAVLLVHRAMRDDHKCRNKYGKAWDVYLQRVPWQIVPYVY